MKHCDWGPGKCPDTPRHILLQCGLCQPTSWTLLGSPLCARWVLESRWEGLKACLCRYFQVLLGLFQIAEFCWVVVVVGFQGPSQMLQAAHWFTSRGAQRDLAEGAIINTLHVCRIKNKFAFALEDILGGYCLSLTHVSGFSATTTLWLFLFSLSIVTWHPSFSLSSKLCIVATNPHHSP